MQLKQHTVHKTYMPQFDEHCLSITLSREGMKAHSPCARYKKSFKQRMDCFGRSSDLGAVKYAYNDGFPE